MSRITAMRKGLLPHRAVTLWFAFWASLFAPFQFAAAAAPGSVAATPTSAEICDVERRPVEDLTVLADEPPGLLMQFREAVGTPFVRPIPELEGVPAEPHVVAGVTATIQDLFACGNAGQMLSVMALSTDDYLRRALGGMPADIYLAMATPGPIPAEHQPVLLLVGDVGMLPDGRVVATTRSSQSTTVNIFVESDGRYLIDDNFDVSQAGTPTP